MTYQISLEKQAVKFVPEANGDLALKLFRKIWPEKYKDGELIWRMADRTLSFDGRAFVLKIKGKIGRDKKGLKHEMNRSLEVFNMLLTSRLPVYAHPEFRLRVAAVQDEMGTKYVSVLYKLRDLAEELPEAVHRSKWGYANPLLDPPAVNKTIKEKK
jgi:hypothetical protein